MGGITDQMFGTLGDHLFSVAVIVLLAYLAKNRYQKGLNKYPGPFLASITNWWRFYDVYKRRPDRTHRRLHDQYGAVVRLGPNCLSFSDPKALRVIYGLNKGFVKSEFYVVQQSVVKGHSLASLFSTTDNDFHAQFRRCVNSAFAMSSLVQYEPFVDNTTMLFLKQTERLFVNNPQGCDFTRWLQFYAFDVIGEITYTKRHGFIEKNEDIDGIVAYLSKLFLYVAPIGQIPILDRLFLKNPIYLKLSQYGFIDSTFPVARFARARMAERLPGFGDGKGPLLPTMSTAAAAAVDNDGETTAPLLSADKGNNKRATVDLLSKFIAAKEARPDFMTDTLVQTMAVSMAFAGSETTAISLSAVFYYLLRTPPALQALCRELDEAARRNLFSDYETGLVTWHESQKLPYLDACVKEAFRLHPAPGLPMERVVPPGGTEIAGHFVPGGTIVGCSAWVMHHNKAVFGQDTDVYRPERWLVDQAKVAAAAAAATAEAEADGSLGSAAVVAAAASAAAQVREREEQRIREMNGMMLQFGMGSRTCIGKNISLLEIYKVVPSLLRRFKIDFLDSKQEWELVNAWFVKQNNFWTTFKLRELVQPETRERVQ